MGRKERAGQWVPMKGFCPPVTFLPAQLGFPPSSCPNPPPACGEAPGERNYKDEFVVLVFLLLF